MEDFVRARSVEQKQLRMNEILKATEMLFSKHTYHEITLTTIAKALNWSRGNLYKYVTTKEEIFLELYLEKQRFYFTDVKTTFADNKDFTMDSFAELWAKALDRNRNYLRYYSLLTTIIETNVTLERLADFKKSVMIGLDDILHILEIYCDITHEKSSDLFITILFHASGLNNGCNIDPLIKEAMKIAGIPEVEYDFVQKLKNFIFMCLKSYIA